MIRCALAEMRRPLHVHAPRAQRVELVDQHLRVDHHAVADHAALARVEDARGDQMQLPLLIAAHDRVPGVVAALEAHDRVAVLGEQIGDLALALVAPLGADYHYSRHDQCSVGRGRPTARGVAGRRPRFRPCVQRARRASRGTRAGGPRRTAAAGRRTSRPGARPSAPRSARRARPAEVGGDDDRALLLVAGVDDRVELLERPVGAVLRAEVVDVQQVHGRQAVEEAEHCRPSSSIASRMQVQQARERVDRDRAPGVERGFGDQHRQHRLAGADVAHDPQPPARVELLRDRRWRTAAPRGSARGTARGRCRRAARRRRRGSGWVCAPRACAYAGWR